MSDQITIEYKHSYMFSGLNIVYSYLYEPCKTCKYNILTDELLQYIRCGFEVCNNNRLQPEFKYKPDDLFGQWICLDRLPK